MGIKRFKEFNENLSNKITLYHGTCEINATNLIENGWSHRSGGYGANMGNPSYLYLSTEPEDALWFAEERGCNIVVEIKDIPLDYLKPDPEDEAGFTMRELLDRNGVPAKFVLTKPLDSSHFSIYKIVNESCTDVKLTPEIIDEIDKFETSEELLRSGGISIEALDRAAHGFSSDDIKTLMPNQLHIKWKEDLENVKYEQEKSGLNKYDWSSKIDLSEPIDVSYENDKFYIEDGHHRYFAAKTLNKPLNVNLEIKMNPIVKLSPTLSYDDFHRCIFNQVKN